MNKVEKKMVAYIEWHSYVHVEGAQETLSGRNTVEEINEFIRNMRKEEDGMVSMLKSFLMERWGGFEEYRKSRDYKAVKELEDKLDNAMYDNIKY